MESCGLGSILSSNGIENKDFVKKGESKIDWLVPQSE
jgi:hypothetical protein